MTAHQLKHDMYCIDLSLPLPSWEKVFPAVGEQIPNPVSEFAYGLVDGKFVIFGGCDDREEYCGTYVGNVRWRKLDFIVCRP